MDRTRARALNALKIVAGVNPTRIGTTPKELVWSRGKVRVWRYQSEKLRFREPVVLFIGLMSRPYIFDLRPGNSFVERLLDAGFDVYLIDWGIPDAAEGNHTLDTYVDDYLAPALEAIHQSSDGTELSILGYCMGATLALLLLGSRHAAVANLISVTAPVDFTHVPEPLRSIAEGSLAPDDLIDEPTGTVPADVFKAFFRLRRPTARIVQYVDLWDNLWRHDYVEGHRAMSQWAWDHIPVAAAAFRQMIDDYMRPNALVNGTARISGRPVRLDQITIPLLHVVAELDDFVPPACSDTLLDLIGSADIEQARVPAGHAGLLVGRQGAKVSIPAIIDWLKRHSAHKEFS
ncbi:alpha/beta fold hydrolase [Nocardia sp. NPDC050630]|uniref:alpha/beta fold hydrolase n=1 Tax=Nocardia sp. NPDC050630 TaxID=3364321 RepID=UPI00379FA1DE